MGPLHSPSPPRPPRVLVPASSRIRPALACAALLVAVLLTAALLPPGPGVPSKPRLRYAAVAEEPPPAPTAGPDGLGEPEELDEPDEDVGTFTELDGGPVWPLPGRPPVPRGWEPPAAPYGPGHRGVDLAARPGAVVLAAASGRVSFAGPVAGRGVLVVELAGSGAPPLRTTYEPVRALVGEGERVVAGHPVGLLEPGPFHCAAGCLHWGLRRGDAYLDPLSMLPPGLLRRGPSRLLPVFGLPEPDGTAGAAGLSRVRRAGSWRRRCPR